MKIADITLCPVQHGGEPALFYAIIMLLAFLPRASTIMSHWVPDLFKEKFTYFNSGKYLKNFVTIYYKILLIHDEDVNE